MIKYLIAGLALVALLFALMPRGSQPELVLGQSGTFFGSEASTWARVSSAGRVTHVGLTLPLDLVANAPTTTDQGEMFALDLEFPDVVKQETYFDHVYLDYSPGGHPPAIYQVPHFDIHFYGVTQPEQLAVDCTDMRMPAESQVPASYMIFPPGPEPDGGCIPQMGIHAVDLTSPELHPEQPQPFEKTMVLGYYGGALTFLEPMITREHLLQAEDFTMSLRLPETLDGPTLYPTGFYADYDEETRTYQLIWWGFQQR